jgi:GNAT superfamily N-acetyltransferase
VLVAYADGEPRPAGLARLVRDGDAAEVAFEVVDAQHGRGVGAALAEALAADARAAGITEFRATVAGDNGRAMSLLARTSRRLRATWLGGERRVVAALE